MPDTVRIRAMSVLLFVGAVVFVTAYVARKQIVALNPTPCETQTPCLETQR